MSKMCGCNCVRCVTCSTALFTQGGLWVLDGFCLTKYGVHLFNTTNSTAVFFRRKSSSTEKHLQRSADYNYDTCNSSAWTMQKHVTKVNLWRLSTRLVTKVFAARYERFFYDFAVGPASSPSNWSELIPGDWRTQEVRCAKHTVTIDSNEDFCDQPPILSSATALRQVL